MNAPTLFEEQESTIAAAHLELEADQDIINQLVETNKKLMERAEKAEATLENEQKVCWQLANQCDALLSKNIALEERAKKKNKRLRAALERYADYHNWNHLHPNRPEEPVDWWVAGSNGYDLAREALKW